ncbi:hypothetical protein BV898_15884 [Hypsibius exemplaris]|uniref:Uncharacterized protein n=1 Tax=Hypsibius exemplaris TaxID=2072580 RepID=A0A9X6NIK7_HYPEX|nr:hypothetical protein BV898_15884 [Hypsibius exemplaris]
MENDEVFDDVHSEADLRDSSVVALRDVEENQADVVIGRVGRAGKTNHVETRLEHCTTVPAEWRGRLKARSYAPAHVNTMARMTADWNMATRAVFSND